MYINCCQKAVSVINGMDFFSKRSAVMANMGQGTKIFQHCTCPIEQMTYNFHLSFKYMHLSFKSVCNKEHKGAGIFFGCLRGRYKAPFPMANAYIFSQFEQKNSQSEGHFYVNQYSLQIAFIFNGLLIKIKHMIRNESDSMQFKRPCLRKIL